MQIHRAERGYSYVLFLWVLAAVVLIVSAFTFYKVYKGSSLANHTSTHCNIQAGVQLCIHNIPQKVSLTDTDELAVTLTNQGTKPYIWGAGSTCSHGPTLTLNNKLNAQNCNTAIATYKLAPKESWSASLQLNGSDLNSGANTIQVEWGGINSDKLTVQRTDK